MYPAIMYVLVFFLQPKCNFLLTKLLFLAENKNKKSTEPYHWQSCCNSSFVTSNPTIKLLTVVMMTQTANGPWKTEI